MKQCVDCKSLPHHLFSGFPGWRFNHWTKPFCIVGQHIWPHSSTARLFIFQPLNMLNFLQLNFSPVSQSLVSSSLLISPPGCNATLLVPHLKMKHFFSYPHHHLSFKILISTSLKSEPIWTNSNPVQCFRLSCRIGELQPSPVPFPSCSNPDQCLSRAIWWNR